MTHKNHEQRSYDWTTQFEALRDFKERNGHCDAKASELGNWVSYVRALASIDAELAKKRGGLYLTEAQKEELMNLDFAWKNGDIIGQKEVEKDGAKDTCKYRSAGVIHEKVNSRSDEKKKELLRIQREDFSTPLSPLSKIGKNRYQVTTALSSLVKSPPEERASTPVSIVRRISANVNNVINGSSHPVELTSTPLHWFPDANYGNNKDWSQCFEMLKSFREKNGHTQVPYKRFPHNHTLTVLSKFVLQMREHKVLKMHGRSNLLTHEREDMLNSIKFEWKASFACTKEGAMLAKKNKSNPLSSQSVETTKLREVKRGKRDASKSKGGVKCPVVVDSEGTLWAIYKPLSVDRLLDASNTPSCLPERPPTPENWGVQLAYESDGSNDSLTF
jgi:hypothetical protein